MIRRLKTIDNKGVVDARKPPKMRVQPFGAPRVTYTPKRRKTDGRCSKFLRAYHFREDASDNEIEALFAAHGPLAYFRRDPNNPQVALMEFLRLKDARVAKKALDLRKKDKDGYYLGLLLRCKTNPRVPHGPLRVDYTDQCEVRGSDAAPAVTVAVVNQPNGSTAMR